VSVEVGICQDRDLFRGVLPDLEALPPQILYDRLLRYADQTKLTTMLTTVLTTG
jgi:hypothetical protein